MLYRSVSCSPASKANWRTSTLAGVRSVKRPHILALLKLGHSVGQTRRMTSDDLTAEQASRLYEALFPHVNYLLRLKKRLEDLRFADDDPLRLAATKAYDSAWELRQEAHRRSKERRPLTATSRQERWHMIDLLKQDIPAASRRP